MIEIVTASHKEGILEQNLLKSKFVDGNIIVVLGYDNIARAYNSVKPHDGLTIYCHHDVFLPDDFEERLAISLLEVPDDWGVLGVAGVKWNGKKECFGHIDDRGREWKYGTLPAEVDTLDELLLITRGDLKFDEQFDLHFYGADICMQAKEQGRKCYAIDAYVHHNSGLPLGYRSDSFRECEKKFRAKWFKGQTLVTTCSTITS